MFVNKFHSRVAYKHSNKKFHNMVEINIGCESNSKYLILVELESMFESSKFVIRPKILQHSY